MDKEEAKKQLTKLEAEVAKLRNIIDSPQKITDRVKDYGDILKIAGVRESDDEVEIKGFNSSENKVVKSLVKKMRIAKVYNEGWLPRHNEQRWYPYYNVSSGFVFHNTACGGTNANTSSASRLCFRTDELTRDYARKFKDVDEDFIDLR